MSAKANAHIRIDTQVWKQMKHECIESGMSIGELIERLWRDRPLPRPTAEDLAEMPDVDNRGARRGHYAKALK